MVAYYNELDPFAARWLRNLISAGLIPYGVVDERSIEDVAPKDLKGFNQCHFFAGIGVWAYALRNAGWGDEKAVWTGSCPCQPFSEAGQRTGFDDERHLWPAWCWLIRQCRPTVIFGEQVASKAIDPWVDIVQADLEALDYAFGCVAFPSAGVGAPHARDRAYFMAHTDRVRGRRNTRTVRRAQAEIYSQGFEDGRFRDGSRIGRATRELANTMRAGSLPSAFAGIHRGEEGSGPWDGESQRCGDDGELADSASTGRGERSADLLRSGERSESQGLEQRSGDVRFLGRDEPAGPTNGFWRDADWLSCRDEKWRPVEPGTFPLADGAPSRVGRLRAYGNAINAEAAKVFIKIAMQYCP